LVGDSEGMSSFFSSTSFSAIKYERKKRRGRRKKEYLPVTREEEFFLLVEHFSHQPMNKH